MQSFSRVSPNAETVSWKPLLSIVVVLIGWQILWTVIATPLLTMDFDVRLIVSALLVFVIGFVMGIPFPFGLKVAGQSDQRLVALAWGINGIFSVVGSILMLSTALIFGFSIVGWLSIGVYLFVLYISAKL